MNLLKSIKILIVGIIIGLFLGFITNNFYNKLRVARNPSKTIVKIEDEKIEYDSTEKFNGGILEIKTKFIYVDKPIFIESTINIKEYLPKNSIYVGTGYFLNSQLLFLESNYTYKNFVLGAKLGYNFDIKKTDFAVNLGGSFSF